MEDVELKALAAAYETAHEARKAAQKTEWEAEHALAIAHADAAGVREGVLIECRGKRYIVAGISAMTYPPFFEPRGARIRKDGTPGEVSVIWRDFTIVKPSDGQ